jgi:hypothetical protein
MVICPISAALLQTTDLDDVRRALKLTVYGVLILLVLAASAAVGVALHLLGFVGG